MENQIEEYHVRGHQLPKKFKMLLARGDIRKIIIKGKDDRAIAEFPSTQRLVGTVLAAMIAAVGAISAVSGECRLIAVKDKREAWKL